MVKGLVHNIFAFHKKDEKSEDLQLKKKLWSGLTTY